MLRPLRRRLCRTVSRGLLPLAVLACLAWPGTGCVPKGAAPPPAAGPGPAAPAGQSGSRAAMFGRPMTLAELLDSRMREGEVTPERLLAPPAEGFEEAYTVQLVREASTVHLLSGVRSYREGPAGLAVGLEDGTVGVFAGWPCASVALSGGGPVTVLGWSAASGAPQTPGAPAGSPVVAAAGEGEKALRIFDLRLCGQTASLDLGSRPATAAVSPTGAYVAAQDEVHKLWLGPSTGPLRHVASLRYPALDLAFTPQESMLMVLDEAGWVTFWSAVDGRLLDKFLIPGGPFSAGSFRDRYARLEQRQGPEPPEGAGRPAGPAAKAPPGATVVWDVASRAKAPPEADRRPFALRDGELTYTMGSSRWTRRLVLGRPAPAASYSRAAGTILLRDLDGAVRGYSYETGLPVGDDGAGPGQPAAPADSEAVPVAVDGSFSAGGRDFRIADPVASAGDRTLYCRAVGGSFYLWWAAGPPGSGPAPPAVPGTLPARRSIRADAAAEPVPLSGTGETVR